MYNSFTNALKEIRAFTNDKRGSIGMIFGLSVIVLTAFAGVAIDFANSYRTRLLVLAAADAAILSTVSNGSPSFRAASQMSGDGSVAAGEEAASRAFAAEIDREMPGHALPSMTATMIKTGSNLTTTIAFSMDVPTSVLRMFGKSSIKISGHATSVNVLPAFIDFYLLLDDSPSMGIAATTTDRDNMIAATSTQPAFAANCAFACHESDYPGTDNYSVARANGITLRIDVLREATQKLMDTAASMATVPNQFRMSIDTFDVATNPISPLTANLAAARTAANGIDIMPVTHQNANADRDTDFDVALADITAKVPVAGTGVTQAHAQKVVFFVTDGVGDETTAAIADPAPGANTVLDAYVWDPIANANVVTAGQRLIQTVNPNLCDALKAKGVKVAVIYTTFTPLPTDNFYMTNVDPWIAQVNPNLQACASPGYFFEVGPNQGIDTAMQSLFRKAVAEARLSS